MTNRRTGKKLTGRCGPAAQIGISLPEALPENAPLQKGVMTEEEAFMSMWVTFQGDRWGNGCSPWSPDVLRVLDPFVPGLAAALLVSVLEEPVDPLPRLQQMVQEHDYKALGAFRPEGSPARKYTAGEYCAEPGELVVLNGLVRRSDLNGAVAVYIGNVVARNGALKPQVQIMGANVVVGKEHIFHIRTVPSSSPYALVVKAWDAAQESLGKHGRAYIPMCQWVYVSMVDPVVFTGWLRELEVAINDKSLDAEAFLEERFNNYKHRCSLSQR